MHDPHTESPPPPRVRVERNSNGTCDRCGAHPVETIKAYDPEVYSGDVCADCLIGGKASDRWPPEHPAMRPMMFVARALKGHEPYARLLRAADRHRKDPPAVQAEIDRIKDRKRLLRAGLLRVVPSQKNRKGRRAKAAAEKKARRKEAKAARRRTR